MATRKDLPLLAILFLALFFRFYNFQKLQYWSADEEIAGATVYRMIAGKTISLVSFNSNLASSLGSFFHVLSVPIFLISSLNPVLILLISGSLGVLTTILLYWAGKLIGGRKLGLIASFLYSSSFLISIFDRRWWPITPNPFLASLAIISLIKIVVYKKFLYWILLAASIGFAFHSDPSLAVIAVAGVLTFVILRPKISKKGLALGLITLSIFIAPLAFFEFRHPGTIIKPLFQSMSKQSQSGNTKVDVGSFQLNIAAETIGRMVSIASSDFLENQFSWTESPQKPFTSPLPELIGTALIFYPLFLIIKSKIKKAGEKESIIITGLFLVSFFVGTAIYGSMYSKGIHQHYFTVIFPVIILLISYSLSKLTENKNKLLYFILLIFLVINTKALLNSKLRYPLFEKETLVKELSKEIGKSTFSLYVVGDEYLNGGGYTELFILNNKHPQKSYIYPYYDWMYKAHGLYTVTPVTTDQEKIIIISDSINLPFNKSKEILRKKVGNIEGIILDNRDFWFKESILNP